MNKYFLVLLLVGLLGNNVVSDETKKVKADTTNLNFKEVAVGRGIDAANADFYCPGTEAIKNESSIFDDEWILYNYNHYKNIDTSVNDTVIKKSYATDFESITKSNNIEYSVMKEAFLGEEKSFGAGASQNFSVKFTSEEKKSLSKAIYRLSYYSQKYKYSLNDISNTDLHRQHLSSGYVSAVKKLFNNEITYSNFFRDYGTHIIGSAVYGGAYDAYYIACSNNYSFSSNTNIDYSEKISAKLSYNGTPVSVSGNDSHKINLGINEENKSYFDDLSITSRGGSKDINVSDVASFNDSVKEWSESVDGHEGLISVCKYVPLWDILPEEYNSSTYIDILKNYYRKYVNEAYDNQIKLLLNNSQVSYTISAPISDKDATIKVQGSFNTSKANTASGRTCIVDLTNLTTKWSDRTAVGSSDIPSAELLSKNGFTSVKATLKCSMRKKDDGIQDFFIGNKTKKDYSVKSLTTASFQYSSKTIYFDKVKLSDIFGSNDEKTIYFILGSHGNGFNAWYVKDVKITLVFYK